MTSIVPPSPTSELGYIPVPVTAEIRFTKGTEIGVGEGSNSRVFLAMDDQLDAQFVIKQIEKASLPQPEEYFAEARRLYDARHRHVVELKFASSDDCFIYFAMPYYRNGSLQGVLNRRYVTVREIVRYGLEFLSGLHHVHIKGLVHFDVKPTNILLDQSDTAALTDFGLSRNVSSQGLATLSRAYLAHAPPEWPNSTELTRATDIYQAGVTLYRMCVGSGEYERQLGLYPSIALLRDAIVQSKFPDRRRRLAHIPARLRSIVKGAMHADVSQRYASVLEIMNALAQVDESLDWEYREGDAWGVGTWNESANGRGRRVELVTDSQGWHIHACRISATGREVRVSAHCARDLTEKSALNRTYAALTHAWK